MNNTVLSTRDVLEFLLALRRNTYFSFI